MNDQSNQTNPVNIKLRSFDSKILYMNGMYKLPIAPYPSTIQVVVDHSYKNPSWIMDPTEAVAKRLSAFQDILAEECREIQEVPGFDKDDNSTEISTLTNLADLLGDIVIFCFSEAAKFGIPLSEVLSIIMDSNFSKLGADGQPIYDDRGKVQKGPFYWKPEEKIKALLEGYIRDAQPKVSDGV